MSKSKDPKSSKNYSKETQVPEKSVGGKPRVVYELDKSHSICWRVLEHEVVDDKIVKTTEISNDIKLISKRKLEERMYLG